MKILVSLLVLNATALITFLCYATADVMCRESEMNALLTFKNDLEDSGDRLSSWRGGENCCGWAGVICSNTTGQVLELRLRNPFDEPCSYRNHDAAQFEAYYSNKLGGKLNPSLLDLKSLTHLDLSCNGFEGERVPDFIPSMRNLQFLDLSSSGFHGEIPQQIANLSRLQHLDLGDRYRIFEGKLSIRNMQWLSYLSSLELLDLTGVAIGDGNNWVEVLENLPCLLELRLSRCGLNPNMISSNVVNFTHLIESW